MKNQFIIPIFKIKKLFLKNYPTYKRISLSSTIIISKVLEFLIQEIIELSLHSSKLDKRYRILPKDINWSMNSDPELSKLSRNIVIPSGGALTQSRKNQFKKNKKSLNNHKKQSSQQLQKNINLNLNSNDYYDDNSDDETMSNYSSKSY